MVGGLPRVHTASCSKATSLTIPDVGKESELLRVCNAFSEAEPTLLSLASRPEGWGRGGSPLLFWNFALLAPPISAQICQLPGNPYLRLPLPVLGPSLLGSMHISSLFFAIGSFRAAVSRHQETFLPSFGIKPPSLHQGGEANKAFYFLTTTPSSLGGMYCPCHLSPMF